MAGTNDFKAFATDANANVTSQEEWETLTALKKGFSSGKASSAQVSKALRQPSTMAAVLGQFIANAELDALDDGDVDGLVAKLATAITTNLGLGGGAKLAAAIGAGGTPGYISIPCLIAGVEKKIVIQWGWNAAKPSTTGADGNTIVFPIAFDTACAAVVATYDNVSGSFPSYATGGYTTTSFLLRCAVSSGSYYYRWIAVGY